MHGKQVYVNEVRPHFKDNSLPSCIEDVFLNLQII